MHWIQLVYIVKEYIVKEYGISLEAKFGTVKLTEKNGKIYNITTDRLFEDNVKRIFRLFLLKNTTLQIIHLWRLQKESTICIQDPLKGRKIEKGSLC